MSSLFSSLNKSQYDYDHTTDSLEDRGCQRLEGPGPSELGYNPLKCNLGLNMLLNLNVY